MTDKEKLDLAFTFLHGKGYATHAFSPRRVRDPWAKLAAEGTAEHCVFYNTEDARAAFGKDGNLHAVLWLHWAGDAPQIISVLEARGLRVAEHDGSHKPIELKPRQPLSIAAIH